jgi:hypothetical protein
LFTYLKRCIMMYNKIHDEIIYDYAVSYLSSLLILSATGSYQQWKNTGLMRDKMSQGTHPETLYTIPKPRFAVTFSCLHKVS